MTDNWQHRSSKMVCSTCMYYVPKPASVGMEVGRCRRYAPTMKGWPVVFPTDWCGDHKIDETKLVNPMPEIDPMEVRK